MSVPCQRLTARALSPIRVIFRVQSMDNEVERDRMLSDKQVDLVVGKPRKKLEKFQIDHL